MKVIQVCIGKFHHFDLARQLSRRDMLQVIFTGYPGWKLRNEGLRPGQISTFPWVQAPYMGLARWGGLGSSWRKNLSWLAQETLDHHAARNLPEADWLMAISASGLHCGKAAKSRGMRVICDRGSSHIRFQQRILSEEYRSYGEVFDGVDPRILDKEEAEYANADLITIPSEFALDSFIEMGVPREKLRKVPYGVDLTRFAKTGEPDRESFDVLYVGQVNLRKGIRYLLDAFARLKHPRKRLTVVGQIAPEVSRYLARNPPADECRFLGHMPQEQLKDIMSRSHVMVLPSVEEGLALVQAQALACGCPVIATRNTGASDLFEDGDCGFIVEPRNETTIAERLQQLADDESLRTKMSAAALTQVGRFGGWDQYGNLMADIFSSR